MPGAQVGGDGAHGRHAARALRGRRHAAQLVLRRDEPGAEDAQEHVLHGLHAAAAAAPQPAHVTESARAHSYIFSSEVQYRKHST